MIKSPTENICSMLINEDNIKLIKDTYFRNEEIQLKAIQKLVKI